GFYTVYRQLFDSIIEQELPFIIESGDDVDRRYPRFGDSTTELDAVKQFYDVWQSYCTSLTFGHLRRHDIREAPNRFVERLMERENRKLREEARKKRNTRIQSLVGFVRKKDPRMERYRAQLQAKVE